MELPEGSRIMILAPGPYLELFGRERVDGWDGFGDHFRSDGSLRYPPEPIEVAAEGLRGAPAFGAERIES